MRLLSWNCQGLGNLWTVRSLQKIVKDQAPKIFFLMETRLVKKGYKKHCKDLPFPNQFIVKKLDFGGGLALLWKNEMGVDVINYTENHILARVREDDGLVWYLTRFYAWLETTQKSKLWALLYHLMSFVEGPWMCIGDFNAILHSHEKQSIRPPPYSQMDEFKGALECCHLSDLGFVSYPFTWNNKQPGSANTRQRLDRAVATKSWKARFSARIVTHLFSHASDHVPLLLQIRTFRSMSAREPQSFKFEES
ncbi:uncharacterized protein LOC142630717 [Castanea sativa]|uniref:uncharacterized protein LOC142630717 n=1 Tax=Castanea sativa TaxID=21020 RepID=UPI003F649430